MSSAAVSSTAHPRFFLGALVAFVGISGANVLPASAQLVFYFLGLLPLLRRPRIFPTHEIVIALLAGVYAAAMHAMAGVDTDGAFRAARPCFEGFLVAQVLYKCCKIRDFRSAAIVLGGFIGIQFVVAIIMILDPLTRAAWIDSIYSDEAYQNTQFTVALIFRGYGFSRHHLYGLPLACGMSAAVLLVAASVERDAKWKQAMSWLPVAAVALVAVNARIGFVPILAVYAAGLTVYFDRFYPKHLLIVTTLILVPIAYFGALYLGDNFDIFSAWLGEGFSQFTLSNDQPDSTTLSDLREMLIFSSNPLELMFGSGAACPADRSCYSDIGFVRAIQEGGFILLTLILYLYARLHRHIMDLVICTTDQTDPQVRRMTRLLRFCAVLTFVAAMTKGEAFAPSDYSRLIATLAFLGFLCATRTSRGALRSTRKRVAPLRPIDGVTLLISEGRSRRTS